MRSLCPSSPPENHNTVVSRSHVLAGQFKSQYPFEPLFYMCISSQTYQLQRVRVYPIPVVNGYQLGRVDFF